LEFTAHKVYVYVLTVELDFGKVFLSLMNHLLALNFIRKGKRKRKRKEEEERGKGMPKG
jgi:hypothetical protein